MHIKITVECRDNSYSFQNDEFVSREMTVEVNDRQVFFINIGNTADAMLQDAAVELMSKHVEKEQAQT